MIDFAEGHEPETTMERWLREPLGQGAAFWLHIGGANVIGLAPAAEIPPRDPSLPRSIYEKPRIIEAMLKRALEQRRHDIDHQLEKYECFSVIRGDTVQRFWRVVDGRGREVRMETIDNDFGDWDRLLAWPKTPKPTHVVDGKRVRWTPLDPHASRMVVDGPDSGSHFAKHRIYADV